MGIANGNQRKDVSYKRAIELLSKVALVDGHNDLPWVIRSATGGDLERFDLARVHPETDTDIPRLQAGKVSVQVMAAYLPTEIANPATVTLEQIDLIQRMEARHRDVFHPIRKAADISAAKRAKKIGTLISVEGTVGCEGSLAPLRVWKQLGVRLVTLCHNGSLPWIDSSTDAPVSGSISDFGRQLVGELNRLSLIIDLSHAAVPAAHAVIGISRAPVVLSHSNAHALCPHPRNAPDDLIRAVAKSGGVVMATFVPEFISRELFERVRLEKEAQWRGAGSAELQKIRARIAAAGPLPEANLQEFCVHVEHLLDLAGPDHVGIGSDFFGGEVPRGLEDASVFPSLFAELFRRGHGENVLARIAGANFIRVMRKVERVSRLIEKESALPTRAARRPKQAARSGARPAAALISPPIAARRRPTK